MLNHSPPSLTSARYFGYQVLPVPNLGRMRFHSTLVVAMGATMLGRVFGEPLRMQLQYKPRDVAPGSAQVASDGSHFQTLAAGLEGQQDQALGQLVSYEFDAAGNMAGASVAVEQLQSLNPKLWAYFASVAFKGNQVVDVLIDTGSAGLGVPTAVPQNWTGKDFQLMDPNAAGATRIPCNDQRCRGHCDSPSGKHFCSPFGGSCEHFEGQDVCTFAWLYGDGSSAQGVLLSSQIDLGGAWVTSTYGGIVKATDTFFEAPRGGGIMGLSFGNYALCDDEFSCFPPLLDDLVGQMGYQDKFAICANGPDAVMILGGGDGSLHEGEVKYVPLLAPYSFYWVAVNDVTLNGASILPEPTWPRLRMAGGVPGVRFYNKQQSQNGQQKLLALVDTGNSAMYLPEGIYDNFKEAVRTALRAFPSLIDRERSIFTGYAMYIAPEVLARMPTLALVMDNGLVFNLPPDVYTTEFRAPDIPVPLRALKVIRGKRFVLGQTVLNHVYLEIDRAAKTIGFAPSKPGCHAKVG